MEHSEDVEDILLLFARPIDLGVFSNLQDRCGKEVLNRRFGLRNHVLQRLIKRVQACLLSLVFQNFHQNCVQGIVAEEVRVEDCRL